MSILKTYFSNAAISEADQITKLTMHFKIRELKQKVQNRVKSRFKHNSPGGSWNNDRTLASGVWNQMAATALYSPSPQYICPQLMSILWVDIKEHIGQQREQWNIKITCHEKDNIYILWNDTNKKYGIGWKKLPRSDIQEKSWYPPSPEPKDCHLKSCLVFPTTLLNPSSSLFT
jgi:hypothetical protein